MYLKKVLNQPNVVGIVMIALLLGAGFVYAFVFDGFNIEIVPSAEVDARMDAAPTYGGKHCNCKYQNTCPAANDKKCKNCNNRDQFRCTDGCKKGDPCHKSCMKNGDADKRICGGQDKCYACKTKQ